MTEDELLEFLTWLWETRGIRLFDMRESGPGEAGEGEFLSMEDVRWQVADWREYRRALL